MSSSPKSQGRSSAGYSLIEMLIVMTILALVATIALPRLAKPSDSLRLKAAAHELHGALRLTRSAAIVQSRDLVLIIDADKRTFESSVVPIKAFAADIDAQLTVAEPERATPSRGGFRFFADGSSTGGDLVLRLRDNEVRICINWLTGEPQDGNAC
jgi:general secretion pathway protein H